MKKEIEQNTLICTRMMYWRLVCLVAAIPFVAELLLSFTDTSVANSRWPIVLACVSLLPMLYYMLRLVIKTNGIVNASFHVLLTVVLTPFFLTGPLLIPILVRGDARRLLLVRNAENAG